MVDSPDNGRVTLAVIRNDIQHLMADQAAFYAEVARWRQEINGRQDATEEWCTTSKERWAQHQKEHERESAVLKTWSVISSAIAAVFASFFGWFVKPS